MSVFALSKIWIRERLERCNKSNDDWPGKSDGGSASAVQPGNVLSGTWGPPSSGSRLNFWGTSENSASQLRRQLQKEQIRADSPRLQPRHGRLQFFPR